MRCRALFVDDEPSILGIYEMLEVVLGEDYVISTAGGPEEAKQKMAEEPADIVISDLVMPGSSGAELLLEISKKYPACGRIAVSGFADQITMAKCLTVAHRYFTKPFNPLTLTAAITQLHKTRLGTDDRLARLVGTIQSLPVPSETYFALMNALNAHSVSLDAIAVLVQKDPSLCSKLLHAANSAMFGARHRCERIVEAIQTLGIETIRTLLLGIQVFELCAGRSFKTFLEKLWRHSLTIATTARHLKTLEGGSEAQLEDAFVAGLLHDVGKVVLAASSSEAYGKIIGRICDHSEKFRSEEQATFGATHAEAGAYLLTLWGLPEHIVSVVAHHHTTNTGNDLVEAIRAAHDLPLTATLRDFKQWQEDQSNPRKTDSATTPKAVLLASADQCKTERLGAMLRANGFTTFNAADRPETFRMLHDLSFSAIIVDESMLGGEPAAIVEQVRDYNGNVEVLLMSDFAAGRLNESSSWQRLLSGLGSANARS